MVAETPARYAAVDDELFDTGGIVHTLTDTRTVGEMLHDADHLSRHLLMDVTGDDAGPMLRSWPGLVGAGSALWESLPRRRYDPHERDLPMQRLVATTSTFSDSLARPRRWPGDGPAHGGVDEISETLRTAGELIARFGADVPAHRTHTARDIDATRARVMHTLYITAHAITVALNTHGKDLVRESRELGRPIPLSSIHTAYAVPPVVAWMQRANRCEDLAYSYLAGRFVTASRAEVTRPANDHDRIPRALARWDIQAHRTLANDPTPANMVLIARGQSLIAGASIVLLDAVERDGSHHLSGGPNLERARSAITHTAASWSRLGSRWHDLTRPSNLLDPALARAAAEVRAAYRELTHDATTQASPDDIATRPGLFRGATSSLDALTAAGELAYGVAEQAGRSDLTGPARKLSHRAHNDVEAAVPTDDSDGDQVWVAPADIAARRLVPLPAPVVKGLLRVSAEVVQDARAASAAVRIHGQSWASNITTAGLTSEVRSSMAPVALKVSRRTTAAGRTAPR